MKDQSWTSSEKVNWFYYYYCYLYYYFVVFIYIMSSIGTPNAGNDNGKISDGLTSSLPHVNNVSPLVQDKLYHKLLTAK